jgi:hypothetical protein
MIMMKYLLAKIKDNLIPVLTTLIFFIFKPIINSLIKRQVNNSNLLSKHVNNMFLNNVKDKLLLFTYKDIAMQGIIKNDKLIDKDFEFGNSFDEYHIYLWNVDDRYFNILICEKNEINIFPLCKKRLIHIDKSQLEILDMLKILYHIFYKNLIFNIIKKVLKVNINQNDIKQHTDKLTKSTKKYIINLILYR